VEAGTCGQGCRDAGGGQRQALVAKAKMGEGRETQQGSGSLRGGAEPLFVVVVHSLARSYSLFHRPLHHSASTITCPQREIPSTRATQSCRHLFSLSVICTTEMVSQSQGIGGLLVAGVTNLDFLLASFGGAIPPPRGDSLFRAEPPFANGRGEFRRAARLGEVICCLGHKGERKLAPTCHG
jgi:hypothetical protein